MQYLLLLSAIVLAIIGQFSLKKGVVESTLSPTASSIIKTIFSPVVLAGFIAYGLGSIIWLFVLQRLPLSVAYPALSLSYVIIVIVSFLFLGEPLTTNKIIGVALIVAGVTFLFR